MVAPHNNRIGMETVLSVKKEQELRFISVVLYHLFPEQEISPVPNERPDWKITINTKIIGIEVTEIPDDILRPVEGTEAKVISQAQEIASRRNVTYSHVRIGFTRSTPIPRGKVKNLATDLVEFVAANIRAGSTECVETPPDSSLLPFIDEVIITAGEHERRHDWNDLRANLLKDLPRPLLQGILSDKSKKIEQYRTQCEECWLIIGAEGTKGSSSIYTGLLAPRSEYESSFDRVFYVNLVGSEFIELRKC